MLRLGQATVTYDAEAEPCEELPWEHITGDAWRCAQQQQDALRILAAWETFALSHSNYDLFGASDVQSPPQ